MNADLRPAGTPDDSTATEGNSASGSAPSRSASDLRALLFRTCFAVVMGAAAAQAMLAVWPAPAVQTDVIGFAAWARQSPVRPTAFFLTLLAAGVITFQLEPRWNAWEARRRARRLGMAPDDAGAATGAGGSAALQLLPWLWVVVAAALPWYPEIAGAALAVGALAGWIAVEIERTARDPVVWRRARLGLAMAAIGYGAGVALLDLLPGSTPGLLDWYNPLMVVGCIGLVAGGWWLWGGKRSAAIPSHDGYVAAAWRLLPLGALPLWGVAGISSFSPWGSDAIGPPHFVTILLAVAAAATVGLAVLARRGARQLAAAETGLVAGAAEISAERLLGLITWLIWPLILFGLVYERNLRLVGVSAQGVPFDFMHWGEWWGPWWDLQADPARRLWVDVFPIHGVGCDILPCSLADACGDATLSGRFQVTAFLNAASFVCFYFGLAAISRARSIALLALLVILWEEPSWFKVWLGDHRYLPLFLWVLAALAVGRALRGGGDAAVRAGAVEPVGVAGALPESSRSSKRLSKSLLAGAIGMGLLPLVCFLTSVDVGYVTLVATAFLSVALVAGAKRLAVEPARARLAGTVAAGVLVLSFGLFLILLGDRRASFLDYHLAVFQAKGAFDFLPLSYADALTPAKVIYVVATPLAVALAGLAAFRGRHLSAGRSPRWAFGPLAVAVVAGLYYKKGLDRSDTAHFEQAAVLTPVLLAFLLVLVERRRALFQRPAGVLFICLGLIGWLGLRQGLDSLVAHPAASEMWGGRVQLPEPHLALAQPRVGVLRCSNEQVRPLSETLAYLHWRTDKGEAIYDFSNSGLWPFLAERRNASRYNQTFHAMTREMQEQVIADLERNRPVIVLFPDARQTVDFVDLTLRQHWIAAWLLAHYQPIAHVGYHLMLAPRDPAWSSPRLETPLHQALPRTKGMEWLPPPDPNFAPMAFIWQQDQGFLPRAFATDNRSGTGAVVLECSPATVVLDAVRHRGVKALISDPRAEWLFVAEGPEPVLHIPLPEPLQPSDADWLEIDLAVSGGSGGAVNFDTGPMESLQRLQQWWRRVLFKIEPVKQAARSHRYRFHLAAMPAWMFQPGPVQAIDIQPTDTAGVRFAIERIRFLKDAPRDRAAAPAPGSAAKGAAGQP